MLARLVPPAVANARREAESLRAANDGAEIAAWDWQYYSEQVRKAEYDLDTAALRPYLELERVLHDGVFFAANKVYGLTFTERPDLRAYHPDARVFEVFNEDGSGLGLFSSVTYPYFSGTRVPRDFVEYPSQVNEMWVTWPEVLANYAKHYRTGEPIPAELVERMEAAKLFGEGFRTVEYLGATLLDWAWHKLAAGEDPGADIAAFEAGALEKAGIAMAEIPPRYRTGYFAHIFTNDYSAGYYSYIWAEVLDADSVDWFVANGGMTRANGDHFRAELLSRGGSLDSIKAFENFSGHAPEIEPLLVRRGLTAR
jgi:Zn-dependent oligopeptidase